MVLILSGYSQSTMVVGSTPGPFPAPFLYLFGWQSWQRGPALWVKHRKSIHLYHRLSCIFGLGVSGFRVYGLLMPQWWLARKHGRKAKDVVGSRTVGVVLCYTIFWGMDLELDLNLVYPCFSKWIHYIYIYRSKFCTRTLTFFLYRSIMLSICFEGDDSTSLLRVWVHIRTYKVITI